MTRGAAWLLATATILSLAATAAATTATAHARHRIRGAPSPEPAAARRVILAFGAVAGQPRGEWTEAGSQGAKISAGAGFSLAYRATDQFTFGAFIQYMFVRARDVVVPKFAPPDSSVT